MSGVSDDVGEGISDGVGDDVGDGIGLQRIAPLGFRILEPSLDLLRIFATQKFPV